MRASADDDRGPRARLSAAALRALHVAGKPLVLPNAWDAATGRLVLPNAWDAATGRLVEQARGSPR